MTEEYRNGSAFVVFEGGWFKVYVDDFVYSYYSDLDRAKEDADQVAANPSLVDAKLEYVRMKALPARRALVVAGPDVWVWARGRWDATAGLLHPTTISTYGWRTKDAAARSKDRWFATVDPLPVHLTRDQVSSWSWASPFQRWSTGPVRPRVVDASRLFDLGGREGEAWDHVMTFLRELADGVRHLKIGITNDPATRAAGYPDYDQMFVLGSSPLRARISATEAALIGFSRREPALNRILRNDLPGGERLTDGRPGVHYVYACIAGHTSVAWDVAAG